MNQAEAAELGERAERAGLGMRRVYSSHGDWSVKVWRKTRPGVIVRVRKTEELEAFIAGKRSAPKPGRAGRRGGRSKSVRAGLGKRASS